MLMTLLFWGVIGPGEGDRLSVAAPPAPAPGHGRRRRRRAPRAAGRGGWSALGVVLVALLVAVVVFVLESFGGAFSTYAVAQAQLPAVVHGRGPRSPGRVPQRDRRHRRQPGPLRPRRAGVRDPPPATLDAARHPRRGPGDRDAGVVLRGPYVVLGRPAQPGTARLSARGHDPRPARRPDRLAAGDARDLDNLLIKLHPAELDAALTALAGALQGNGTSLGHNLVRANTYFQQMLPLWPTVVSNLKTLVPVANQFAASTPDILQILANQTITARTINDQAVRRPPGHRRRRDPRRPDGLSCSPPSSSPYAVLAADSGPFLTGHLAEPPRRSPSSSQGLDAWAKAWTAAESSGPYLNLTQTEVVANPADLGLAVLGGPAGRRLPLGRAGARVREPADLHVGRRPSTDRRRPGRRPAARLLGGGVGSDPGGGRAGPDPGRLADRHGGERFAALLARRLDPAALARPRGPGDPIMRSHHRRPGLTGTIVKVVVFTVVSVILTSIVISSLLDVNTQAATGYFAEFSNASGLQAGDTVRIAGVEVGKVSAVTLQQNHADVSFSVDNSQHLTTTTLAAIHFENLLGQRFLAILPGRRGGKPLPPGGVIPLVAHHAGAST